MKITGRVADNADNSGISGATVAIYYKPYTNGVYSGNYSYLTSASTDGSGSYSFDMEKPNTSDFKFVVTATNYFGTEKVVNPDNLSTASSNSLDFGTDPSCNVIFHFKNQFPWDVNDHMQFHPMGLLAVCETCCTNAVTDYSGTTVDQTFSCLRYAKRYFKYQYTVTKNGSSSTYIDSVYCTFGSSAHVDILY